MNVVKGEGEGEGFFSVIRAVTLGQLREFPCLPVLRFLNMKVIIDLLKEEIHMDTHTQREYIKKERKYEEARKLVRFGWL